MFVSVSLHVVLNPAMKGHECSANHPTETWGIQCLIWLGSSIQVCCRNFQSLSWHKDGISSSWCLNQSIWKISVKYKSVFCYIKRGDLMGFHSKLVGGWTNPIWKILVKLDHFPKDPGWKWKDIWNHHPGNLFACFSINWASLMGSFKPPCPLRKSHFPVRTAGFMVVSVVSPFNLNWCFTSWIYLPHFLMDTGGIPFNKGNYSLRNPIKRGCLKSVRGY